MDTKSVCRVCMSSCVTLMELFAETSALTKEPSLADMLSECVDCEVQLDDPLPNMICLTCVIETKNAYRFKMKCEQSHKSFWKMHNKAKAIQVEEEEEEEVSPMDTSLIKIELPEITEEKPKAMQVPRSSIMRIKTVTDQRTDESSEKGLSLHNLLSDTSDIITLPEQVKTFKCPHCRRIFKDRLALQGHVHVHGRTPFQCGHCAASFTENHQLEKHLQSHDVERRFECAQCLKRFSTEINLQLHSRSHSGFRSPKYQQCLKTLDQLPDLRNHLRIHAPHKCPYCPMSFPRKQDVNYHVLVHTGERPHKCPHCDKAFKKKQHRSHLNAHIRALHIVNPFKCPHCPKSFARKMHCDEHLSLHSGVWPYKCDDCHKEFRSNGGFKKHICLPAHDELRNAHLSLRHLFK
ncbi:hypothetical protein KR044_010839 [Drosophila immigrans]|nr:hypothetical protein KR044_010839 [Drosophila immigrans]